MDTQRKKVNIALLSVISNSILVIVKLTVGMMIGAVSIISEAIHSAVDLVASGIALYSVKTSSVPPDPEHPFGHGKIENISGTIEAVLIFLAAGWIIYEAIKKILHPEPLDALGWGVGVMLFSAAANYVISGMLFKVGQETDSIALEADAVHLRMDVWTSAGVMLSLGLIWAGKHLLPEYNLNWLDPVCAFGVALLIIKAAYELTVKSFHDLLDARLPKYEVDWIKELITKHDHVIHGFHYLRTRKAGNYRFIEFHLKVDPNLTVRVSHEITVDLTQHIQKKFPDTSVSIHVEPCDGDCQKHCLEGCLLSEKKRGKIRKKKNFH